MIRTFSLCCLYALLNVTGAAIIKWKLKDSQLIAFSDWINFLLSYQVIIAFIIIFFSALVLFKALSTAEFSFVIPVVNGINFTFTLLIGYLYFKDHLNGISIIGFLLILTGITILALNTANHAQ
jgi:multidrug transporter EmrE-like cation transporter